MVLDRGHPGVLEDDVGDTGGRTALARVGADSEGLGRGVRGLADDVLGSGVADDGVLDPVLVHDGGDRTALDAVDPVVPDTARDGDDDERQALGAEVPAVGLQERRGGLEPRVGVPVAARARPAVTVDVHVGLPEHRAVDTTDRDGGGGARIAAVQPLGHPDAATRPGQQFSGGHTALPVHGPLRMGQGGQGDGGQQGGADGGQRQRADTHDEEPSPGGDMTDTHPKVVRVKEDGHRERAGRITAPVAQVRGRGPGPESAPAARPLSSARDRRRQRPAPYDANGPGKHASSRRVRAPAYVSARRAVNRVAATTAVGRGTLAAAVHSPPTP